MTTMLKIIKSIWKKWGYLNILLLFAFGISLGNVINYRSVTIYKVVFFVSAIIFVFWFLHRKELKWHVFFTFFALYIFSTFLFFGVQSNPHSMTSKFYYILRIIVHFLFIFFIYNVYMDDNNSWFNKTIFIIVIIGTFVNGAVCLSQLFSNQILPVYLQAHKKFFTLWRVEGVWMDPNYNGAFIVICINLLLYLRKSRKINVWLFSAAIFINLALLVFTASLGSLAALILSMIVFMTWEMKLPYKYGILFFILIVSSVMLFFVFPSIREEKLYLYPKKHVLKKGKTVSDALVVLQKLDYFNLPPETYKDITTEEDLGHLLNILVRDYKKERIFMYYHDNTRRADELEQFYKDNKTLLRIFSEYYQTHPYNHLYFNRIILDDQLKGIVKDLNVIVKKNVISTDMAYYIAVKLSYGSFQSRVEQMQVAWNAFKDHPVFGVGIMAFENKENQYRYMSASGSHETNWGIIHNSFLSVLAENGLFGFIFYLFLVGNALRLSIRLEKLDTTFKGILSLEIAIIVASLGIHMLFWHIYWFILFIPCLLWEIRKRRSVFRSV